MYAKITQLSILRSLSTLRFQYTMQSIAANDSWVHPLGVGVSGEKLCTGKL